MKHTPSALFFSIFATALFAIHADAATLHVHPSGGDCSKPQDCIGRLNSGDTLLIHEGTYPGFDMSGREGITVKAAPGERAIIYAYLGSSEFGTIIAADTRNVTLGDTDGTLEITNTDPWIDQMRQMSASEFQSSS